MAGAYCRYCDRRCFVLRTLPDGSWSGHMATCPAGAAYDREQTGYDHTTAINPATEDLPTLDHGRLRDLAQSVRDLGLTGRWTWRGNIRHGEPSLQTERNGGQFILGPTLRHEHVTYTENYDDEVSRTVHDDCHRSSCPHASTDWNEDDPTHSQDKPTLSFRVAGDTYPHLVPAHAIARYQVAPDATSESDPRVYRHDVTGFRSPVADYLAALDADTVLALLDENTRLREQLARIAA